MPVQQPIGKKHTESGLRLPVRAYIPGTGSQPDQLLLDAAIDLAPCPTDPRRWRANRTYLYGHELDRARYHWEAHEVWETVWLACRPNSLEQLLLRTLIARANARLKLHMGQPRAAQRLTDVAIGLGRELSVRLPPDRHCLMGVEVCNLIQME
jgi:hypothetical protein